MSATLLSLVAGLMVTVTSMGPVQAAEVWRTSVALPANQRVTDLIVDESHDRLYLLMRSTSGANVVTLAEDGTILGQVSVPDAQQFALSNDGARLYINDSAHKFVTVVDTDTLAVSSIAAQRWIEELAVVGNQLWYLARDASGEWDHLDLRVMDLTTGRVRNGPAGGSLAGGQWGPADLRTVPGHHQLLLNEYNDATLAVVDTTTNSLLSTARMYTTHKGGFDFSADGTQVLIGDLRKTYGLPGLPELSTLTLPSSYSGAPVHSNDYLLAADTADGIAVFGRAAGDLLNLLELDGDSSLAWPPLFFNSTLIAIAGDRGTDNQLLYLETTPEIAPPALTFAASPAVATRPVTLSGTLIDGDESVAGAEITVRTSRGQLIGSATTDDLGVWSLAHTWPGSGGVSLVATAEGGPVRKPVAEPLHLDVDGLPAVLDLSAPTTVAPGDSITVTGHLTSALDGTDVAGADLYGVGRCPDSPRFAVGGTPRIFTDAEGRFSVTYDPKYCGNPEFEVMWHDGAAPGVRASVRTLVPWHVAELALDADKRVFIGDTVQGVATFTIDGTPVASTNVRVTTWPEQGTGSAVVQTVATDERGKAEFEFPTSHGDGYTITAEVDPTADTTWALATVDVMTVPSLTTVTTVQVQKSISLGEQATIRGFIERSDGVVGGVTLRLAALDYPYDGATRFATTVTDSSGHYEFHDTPVAAGMASFAVLALADGERYPESSAPGVGVTVRATPTLSLTTDRTQYVAGQTAAIRIGLRGSWDQQVTLTGTTASGVTRKLFVGTIPVQGLTLHRVMNSTEVLSVQAPAGHWQDAAHRSRSVKVRALVTQEARSRSIGHGAVPVYSQSSSPLFAAQMRPGRHSCLTFEVQKRTSRGWRSTATSPCRSREGNKTVRWAFTGPHRYEGVYRIHTRFAGDALNESASSAWMRFRLA